MTCSRVVLLIAILGVCAGCGDDDSPENDAGPSLTVDRVVDFTTDHHTETPFHEGEDPDPLTDCSWQTGQTELDEWGAGAAALFHCPSDEDEDGAYPVVVYEYDDASAARAGIEDRLLATDSFLFAEEGIVVDSFSVDDEPVRAFYEALIEDCGCGKILVVGEDL